MGEREKHLCKKKTKPHIDWLLSRRQPDGMEIKPATRIHALDRELNPRPLGVQADALTSEQHWPGQSVTFQKNIYFFPSEGFILRLGAGWALCQVTCSALGAGKEVSTLVGTYYYSPTPSSCSATEPADDGALTTEGRMENGQGQALFDCPSARAHISPVRAGWSMPVKWSELVLE